MKIIYIYTLCSSRDPDNIRYIGKTKNSIVRRKIEHIRNAKRSKKIGYYHNYNHNWINKELSNGATIIVELLDVVPFEHWKESEQYWISQFRTWGFKLTNLTDGGEGNVNQVFSKESLQKKRLKLLGRKRTYEECRAISLGHLGKKLTEAHKNNVRQAIIRLQGKPILQFSLSGEFLQEWQCIKEAANYYHTSITNISRACTGYYKQAKGFRWKYKMKI